jgi:ABC-type lipoprotein release transport system permease subunit
MLLALAWKNIWRNKKRSLVILTAIALGLWAGLFSVAVMIGSWDTTVNSTIDRNLSHIQIHTKEFKDDNLISFYIPGGNKIANEIKNMPEVNDISARVLIEGMASSPSSSRGVNIIGVYPADEKAVTTIAESIVEGDYFNGIKRNPVLIGQKLANKLGLKLRSKLVLSFQSIDTTLTYAAFRIAGIFKTESSQFDEANVFVKKTDLYNVMNSQPIVNEIAIRLNQSANLDTTLAMLKKSYAPLVVESWKELAPELSMMYEYLIIELEIFLAIIMAALLFGITNTMLMSVLDRVREFGVLLAVGMKRLRVFLLIMIETLILSLIGGIVGMVMGSITVWYFSDKGIDLSLFSEGLSAYGMPTLLYPILPMYFYGILTIMIIITAILAAFYPSFKTIKLRPADAIRTYG